MNYTVDQLMTLAYDYADEYAESCVTGSEVKMREAQEALRTALTEALGYLDVSLINEGNKAQLVQNHQSPIPFVPWSKEAEMMESWTHEPQLVKPFEQRVSDLVERLGGIEYLESRSSQPVQEPCKTLCELCVKRGHSGCANTAQTTPIVVAQPVRAPLTDEQILSAVMPLYGTAESAFMGRIDDIATARAIKRAHGIGGDK